MGKLRKFLPIAALIGLCALIFTLRLHTYNEPLQRDLTTYAVIAHEMLNGKNLYRDLWDHKPPAIHVTYAAAELIAGYGRDSILLMNVVAACATLFLCYWAGSVAGRSRISGCFAAAFWALISGNLLLEGNQPNTEVFMNVFLAAAFAILVLSGRNGFETRRALLVGILFGVASLYKQVIVVIPACLAVAYLVSCKIEARKKAIADFSIIALTGIAIWALVFAYFFARGSGVAFTEAVFGYNRYYSSNISHQDVHQLQGWASLPLGIVTISLSMLILTLVGIVFGVFVLRQQQWILLFSYIVGGAISVLMPGWFFAHYFQLLLPPLAIGAGWSIELIRRNLPERMSYVSFGAGSLACAALIVLELPDYFLGADDWSTRKYGNIFVQTEQLAGKIDKLLLADETFYEWGSESGLYFATGRTPPSGIIFVYPMLGGPLKEKLSGRLINDLNRAKPELIVADLATMTLTDRQHPVLNWLKENYRTFARTDEFLLLARKESRLDTPNANLSTSPMSSTVSPIAAGQD